MSETPAPRGLIARYVVARLGQALLVLWAAYTLSFLVLYALPSDPVALLAGGDATDISPAQLDDLRQRYGLDQPLWVQYLLHLRGILTGDLGTSISTGRPVSAVIGEAIPPTAQLAGLALVVAVLLGVGIAITATFTRSRRLASFLLGLPPLGVAVPSFWLGLVLIQWFSFQLPLFPAMGDKGFASLVLPAVTLAVPTSAAIAQLLAKSLAVTLGEPYIDTAWAKGVGRARVHVAHALRNAALPALTVTGLVIGQLLSGTVVTETVFSRPGIGRVTAQAVQQQDVPVVQGIVLFAAAVFVLTTLAVDLVYPLLDPRIVLSAGSPRRGRRWLTGVTPEQAVFADAAPIPDGLADAASTPDEFADAASTRARPADAAPTLTHPADAEHAALAAPRPTDADAPEPLGKVVT